MRIVVTGGSGLVGRAVLRRLAPNHDVINVDLVDPNRPIGRQVRADILDHRAMRGAIGGADAVVHAAAIPGPSFGTEEDIDRVNVCGTEVVARAALDGGVRAFIFVSSESVLGFVFSEGRVTPRYFPIDEYHPLSPSEPYGRSKLRAEAMLARDIAPAMKVVSLRPPWVWVPEEYDRYRALTTSPQEWWDGLWAYVHGDDLTRAVELAILSDLPRGHHPLYVTASDNGTIVATRELLREYYPAVPIRREIAEFGSLISSRAARGLLGFEPKLSWRQFLSEC
jgi:nucleoside-diphosphate-sugar epimerase